MGVPTVVLLFVAFIATPSHFVAHAKAKKVRVGIQSNDIGFLPFHLAYRKGFYREQGIDLETIFMSTQAVNAVGAALLGVPENIRANHSAVPLPKNASPRNDS